MFYGIGKGTSYAGRPKLRPSLSLGQSSQKMNCKVLMATTTLPWASIPGSSRFPKLQNDSCPRTFRVLCSSSSPELPLTGKLENNSLMTGGAYDFENATTSLTQKLMSSPKKVTLIRHGLSSWNEESRIQGSSNLSILTEIGVMQAERCRKALADMDFDQCFSSPISRAKSTAEVIWQGREEPLVFLNSLEEAHLFYLEGMKNVDARQRYPQEYTTWREDPSNFSVNGVYPVLKLWETASEAWKEILFTPGENFLVVTHKSMLRALICTALGLEPERYVLYLP
ncbi:unnamed protein product [Ilex paraguariensis]|uniref:2-carboxy-D-arabinitol-1-phosphatase n=1 Tax=Ilex paraguariensis TaxID=185542 RepID=A0ABC8ULP0_9AQUA